LTARGSRRGPDLRGAFMDGLFSGLHLEVLAAIAVTAHALSPR
jgi:hypothetical protein